MNKKGNEEALTVVDSKHFVGIAAVWIDRDRIVALDKNRQLCLRDFNKPYGQKLDVELENKISDVFVADQDFVLIREGCMLHKYSVKERSVVASVEVREVS